MLPFDTIAAYFISLVALLMSSPVMWCEEHLWDISVLRRVYFSNLVYLFIFYLCDLLKRKLFQHLLSHELTSLEFLQVREQ
jgi:hypothetical protein